MTSEKVLALVVAITAVLTVLACGSDSQDSTGGDAPFATSVPTVPPVQDSSASPTPLPAYSASEVSVPTVPPVQDSSASPAPLATYSASEVKDTVALVDCVPTPSQTEGPYYFDTGEFRRDITEGLPGTPLLVSLRLVEIGSCEPVAGATVDIWHANASGLYSGYPDQGTTGETYLRGKQVTDANGVAEFETIYPGWYVSRAVHIHFMAYTDDGRLVTSQLYFPEAVSEAVYQTEIYAGRGLHPVTNDDDGILQGDTVDNPRVGQVTQNGEGYMVSLTVGVDSGSYQADSQRLPGRRGSR